MNRFAQPFAESIATVLDAPVDEVRALIESPPRPEMGQLAFPCFQLARLRRQAPPAIAAEIAEQLRTAGVGGAVREVAATVWVEYAARSPMAKRVYDSQIGFLRRLGLLGATE